MKLLLVMLSLMMMSQKHAAQILSYPGKSMHKLSYNLVLSLIHVVPSSQPAL